MYVFKPFKYYTVLYYDVVRSISVVSIELFVMPFVKVYDFVFDRFYEKFHSYRVKRAMWRYEPVTEVDNNSK